MPDLTLWEYMQKPVPAEQLLALCQQAGQEGWEGWAVIPGITLITEMPVLDKNGVIERVDRQQMPGVLCLFKRPQQGEGTRDAHHRNGRIILP